MASTESVSRKGFLLVLIPVVFELVFFAGLAFALFHAEQESDQIERSKATLEAMNGLDSSIVSSMMSIVRADREKDQKSLDQLDREIEGLISAKKRLSMVDIAQSNANSEWFQAAQSLCERTIIIVGNAKKSLLDPDILPSKKLLPVRHDIIFTLLELRPLKEEVISKSDQVHALAPQQQARDMTIIYTVLGLGLLINVFISIVLVAFFTRDFEQRLSKISSNARSLAFGQTLALTVGGNDEITTLDRILRKTESELADARRKELSVLDNAVDVIVSLDKSFHITAVGQAANKVWNYNNEDLLGQSIFFFLTEETTEESRNALKSVELTGKEGSFENTVRLKDGSLKETSWSASWSSSSQSYYCVAHDISERKTLERLKQRFAAIIGEDLNTSLQKISQSLLAMKSGELGKLEGKAYDNVFKAEVSIHRLIELTNDLLDLEKIESGKLTVHPKSLRASTLCNAAVDAVEQFARGAKIELKKPTSDAEVMGEERRIVQALINLLSNAIKFSPSNTSIAVEVFSSDNYVDISVIDHGAGIPEKDQTLIFEKFGQSQAVSDKGIKSTGLGLAIVKAIMDAHGGSVSVESKENEGSKFTLRFPKNEGRGA